MCWVFFGLPTTMCRNVWDELELGDQLSEMLLCPALATQLLIYSLVTLVCIGPPREHSLVRKTDPQIQGHR